MHTEATTKYNKYLHAEIFWEHACRSFLTILVILFSSGPNMLSAQHQSDSVLIRNTVWQSKTITEGLVWKKAHFDSLFASGQEVNLLEIDLQSDRIIAFAGVSEGFKKTSEFAEDADALAAINATFFNTKTGGSVTRLKIDGQLINETSLLLPDGRNHERANGALVLDDGHISIIAADSTVIGWDKRLEARNVMVCGPVLLLDGKPVTLQNNAFNNNRHPRSAVGITKDNKLILLTVDGRNTHAHGMSLHELAFLLRLLGTDNALNLDGGGSTTLYVKGGTASGVVNYPSDNKLFDHAGEREVANVILVY